MLNVARGCVGVLEVGGNNRGPQVEAWLKRAGGKPGDSWCMALQWCILDDACRQLGIVNVLRPRLGVVRTYGQLPPACYLADPAPGCWGFHHDLVDPGLGHIVLVEELPKPPITGVFTIEGNTNREGSRNGNGVWRHTPTMRPLAYFNLGWADVSVLFASQLAPAGLCRA
jgi:hypothetical protein